MKLRKRMVSALTLFAMLCALTSTALAGNQFFNNGTFTNHEGATFTNQGLFENSGTFTNNGILNNYKTFSGRGKMHLGARGRVNNNSGTITQGELTMDEDVTRPENISVGSEGSVGTNGFSITFEEMNPNQLEYVFSAPETATASEYLLRFCNSDGMALFSHTALPSDDTAYYDVGYFDEGNYTKVMVYEYDEASDKVGILLAEIPFALTVVTDSSIPTPAGLTVQRGTVADTYEEYNYYVSGEALAVDSINGNPYNYIAIIDDSYRQPLFNYSGGCIFFKGDDSIQSVGICRQTWEKVNGTYVVKYSKPNQATSIETLPSTGYALTFDVDTVGADSSKWLTYSLSAPEAGIKYGIRLINQIDEDGLNVGLPFDAEAGTSSFAPQEVLHAIYVAGDVSYNEVVYKGAIISDSTDFSDGQGTTIHYDYPVAEITIPTLTVAYSGANFPASDVSVIKEIYGGSFNHYTYTVTGLTNTNYAYYIGVGKETAKLGMSGFSHVASSSYDAETCTLSAYQVTGDATTGYTVTWTQDLENVPITNKSDYVFFLSSNSDDGVVSYVFAAAYGFNVHSFQAASDVTPPSANAWYQIEYLGDTLTACTALPATSTDGYAQASGNRTDVITIGNGAPTIFDKTADESTVYLVYTYNATNATFSVQQISGNENATITPGNKADTPLADSTNNNNVYYIYDASERNRVVCVFVVGAATTP